VFEVKRKANFPSKGFPPGVNLPEKIRLRPDFKTPKFNLLRDPTFCFARNFFSIPRKGIFAFFPTGIFRGLIFVRNPSHFGAPPFWGTKGFHPSSFWGNFPGRYILRWDFGLWAPLKTLSRAPQGGETPMAVILKKPRAALRRHPFNIRGDFHPWNNPGGGALLSQQILKKPPLVKKAEEAV